MSPSISWFPLALNILQFWGGLDYFMAEERSILIFQRQGAFSPSQKMVYKMLKISDLEQRCHFFKARTSIEGKKREGRTVTGNVRLKVITSVS